MINIHDTDKRTLMNQKTLKILPVAFVAQTFCKIAHSKVYSSQGEIHATYDF